MLSHIYSLSTNRTLLLVCKSPFLYVGFINDLISIVKSLFPFCNSPQMKFVLTSLTSALSWICSLPFPNGGRNPGALTLFWFYHLTVKLIKLDPYTNLTSLLGHSKKSGWMYNSIRKPILMITRTTFKLEIRRIFESTSSSLLCIFAWHCSQWHCEFTAIWTKYGFKILEWQYVFMRGY